MNCVLRDYIRFSKEDLNKHDKLPFFRGIMKMIHNIKADRPLEEVNL